MAPSITAGVVFCFFLLLMVVMAKPGQVPALPYVIAPSFVLLAMFLVWVFYCLDALYGERRDRSILFWKSLPVSDLTTVLSKAAIPLLVLPAVTFAITAALVLALWLAHKATGLMVGLPLDSPVPFPLLRTWAMLLYGLTVMTLWRAPVYAWVLLVSAWARRATLVWAVLPFATVAKLEQVLLGTKHLSNVLMAPAEAFVSRSRPFLMIDPMDSIAPAKFLSSAYLWGGLAVAALFLFAAARLRRWRSPL
jgi:ABC-2 type transport system permease protein